ncbi:hypothetical protein THICB2_730162 [Thiomonas sp. CB2]|nr:hypothetical protein THICB2_730162 [Thiomonas sp. CB2]VDY06950.1 protein of unknown function [Thiomonas sp. Bio17B3]
MQGRGKGCENGALCHLKSIMDAERLNAISNRITDLQQRVQALRGYL